MGGEEWADDDDDDSNAVSVSEDSDFYGSEKTRRRLEREVLLASRRPYQPHPFLAMVIGEPPSNPLPQDVDEQSLITMPFDRKFRKITTPTRRGGYKNLYSEHHSSPLPNRAKLDYQPSKPGTKQENIPDFLKSRPQLAGLRDASKFRSSTIKEGSRKVSGETADDFVADDGFRGDDSAWQHDESVLDFLRRLPVEEPATAAVGPWLWVGSPFYKHSWQAQSAKHDFSAFMNEMKPLFANYAEQRKKIELQNPGKPPATITRKLGPYRDVLEENVLSTAVKTGVTCGKWMLFPLAHDLPRVWRTVAEATAAGKLGPTSKVGTYEPGNETKGTLICIYTYNFADFDDVKRALLELVDLNLVGGQLRTTYYKCDAYTYLDLGSDNPYKIRASLYSSKDVLENEPKVREDGVVARLTTRIRAMEDFFT